MSKFSTLIPSVLAFCAIISLGFNWNPDENCANLHAKKTIQEEKISSLTFANIVIDNIATANPTDCDANDGTITITATGTGALEYSVNGGISWQIEDNFSNLSAGLYSVVVREVDLSCTSDTIEVELTAPNAPSIEDVVTNDPASCDISNGVIVITASGGTGFYEYSIDGGLTWQTINTFNGLNSGSYPIALRNDDGTCEIFGGMANLIGDPSEPQISDIFTSHPTDCGVTDGIITITLSNASGDFEYSIDNGATWQTNNNFLNLGGGIYNILVRKTDETCEVSGSSVELTEPTQPVIDSVNPINPTTCVSMDGTIVINTASGSGFLQYSIDGGNTWETTNTFFDLDAGTYSIAVRNTNGSCLTIGQMIDLTAPTEPAISNIFVSDPSDCVAENGGIIVSATGCGGGDIEFSIDGGATWQLEDAFPNLGAGNYEILIRNVGETATVSTGILTINAPDPAVIDSVESTDPDCTGAGGNITINATGNNGDLEYSINGGNTWQNFNTFDNVMAGSYTPTVRFPDSGCITTGDALTLTQSGNSLNIDEVLTQNPGCGNPNGTITVNIVSGADLEFTIDGGDNWQSANFFDNLAIGTYTPGARLAGGGCETLTAEVTLSAADEPEIQGVTFTNVTDCGLMDGTITIAASSTINLEFSINGGLDWQTDSEFNGLVEEQYSIFVRNIDGTCSVDYDLNPVIIGNDGDIPLIEDIQITPPASCGLQNGAIVILASGSSDIEFSVDNGQTFQSNGSFSDLPTGVYDIVVRFVGSNCQATDIAEIGNAISCSDTIHVEIPFETGSEICLDETVLEIEGTLTDAEFCAQGDSETVFAPIINNNCVSLFPANGFLGESPDTICTIHCYDNDSTLCDTTYFIVTVLDIMPPCDEVFGIDTITVMQNGLSTEVCVPVPTLQAFNSNLFLNGDEYNDDISGCLEDSIIFYTYALLNGGGFDGPFTLDSWQVNGSLESGTFANAVELLSLMNSLDPAGNWTINTDLSILQSENATGDYGNMNIVHDPSGNMTTLQTNVTSFPNGTIINVEETGVNEFVVMDPDTGCSDTLYIVLEGDPMPMPTPSDTIITTFINTATDEIIIDDSELPGGINTLVLCELTANGGISFPNNSFIYTPNTDFLGKDTFCIEACNPEIPAICDTLNVIVCVVPPTDTLILEMSPDEVIDTCLTDLIQLPDGIATADICGIDINAVTATLTDDCIDLDPDENFEGETEICVVHCDGNGNCDTTIIIITIGIPCPDVFTADVIEVESDIDPVAICLPAPFSAATNTVFFLDNQAYNGIIEPCDDGMGGENLQIIVSGIGVHTFRIVSTITGCSDEIEIIINEPVLPPQDTIFVTIPQGTQNEVICGDGEELPGEPFNVGFCEIPSNGVAPILNDSCVAYTPGPGFVGMDEFCMIICDDLIPTTCDTFIVIITVTPILPPVDTIFIDAENTMAIDTCLDNQFIQLDGNIVSADICGFNPDDLDSFDLDSTCVSFDLADDFTGTTELCVVHCDDSVPELCDTTIFVISFSPFQPPTDTIFIEAENTMAIDTCLDNQFIQLDGNIVSADICGFNPDDFDSIDIDSICVSFDLVDDFMGTTELCVVHCDDSVPEVCDTTIFIISIEDMPCPDIVAVDTVTLLSDGSGSVDYCLPIPTAEILNYNLTLDGMNYTGGFNPCDIDSVFIYNYALVPAGSPYDIEWDAGGAGMFIGTIDNIEDLVDSLNVWDPAGNWIDDPDNFVLASSNEGGMYGILMINQISTGISNDLQPNFTGVPNGTLLTFSDDSNHNLVIEEISTGCTDSVYFELIPTIFIETVTNTPSETVCLDTLDLPSNFDTLQVCQQPNEGMILIDGNCFTYLPLGGFNGMDTTWLKVCDDMMNCDSTLIIITINPLCNDLGFLENDTLSFELENCPANAEVCLPIGLDSLASSYNILDNGMPYSEGFTGCDFDTCVNYSSFSIPDQGLNGPYTLMSWQVGDTTFMGEFENLDALIDSMNFWNPNINWELNETTGNIRGCNISETYGDLQIVQNGSGQMAIVDAVPDFFPNGSQIQLTEGFHELVFIEIENGCTDTLLADVECIIEGSPCSIMTLSDTFILVDDCADTGEVCFDISVFDAANFVVTIGDTIFSSLSACQDDPQFIGLILPVGDHHIIFEDTVKMCVDSFDITISCQMFEDITIDTTVTEGGNFDICLEDLEFPLLEIDSVINVCADQSTGNVDFFYDEISSCINILGEVEGFDTACFKVYLLDTCATVFINVEVLPACNIGIINEENIGVGVTDCNVGIGDICLPIPFVDFPDYTLEVNGTEYMGEIEPCDFDSVFTIFYSQFPSGGQLGPYIINSWCINGDEFTGVVDSPQDLVDSLAIWDPGCNWEIQMNGSVTTIVGGCSGNTYCEQMVVEQEINPGVPDTIAVNQNFFPNGTQIELAIGSFELRLTDTLGCFDLVTATVQCVETDTFVANVPIDSTATFCIDTMELLGNLDTIFNACPDNSGEFVQFEIISDTCLTYTGIEVGTDTACIVICDDLGVCDTTYIFITTTSDETQPPIANDDMGVSGQNQPPVIINVVNNDSFLVVITDIFVLVPPNFGDVEYLGDGQFQYVPDEGYCDSVVPDSFMYVVCNSIGCDTATVFIQILCTEFEIFDGFSPNMDEINETWVIRGIEQFDNHIVRIFNRWGSRVYETRDYHLNEWRGQWDGNDVPDGTYFYVIDLGNGDVLKGFVELRR